MGSFSETVIVVENSQLGNNKVSFVPLPKPKGPVKSQMQVSEFPKE